MKINDYTEIDQWKGNYWVNSEIENLNHKLSIDIGPRWATSDNEERVY